MTAVKICGITRVGDGLAAARLGADAVGFVFAPSPRQVTPETARAIGQQLPPFISRVGVFVDTPLPELVDVARTARLDVLQLHRGATPELIRALKEQWPCRIVQSVAVRGPLDVAALAETTPADALLLDTYDPRLAGGSGRAFPWEWLQGVHRARVPVILAGGLTPSNVAVALRTVRPYGVDVSSGVEASKGIKDAGAIRRFIAEVRRFDLETDPEE